MPKKMRQRGDSNFENDIKTVLKKLNVLEQKLNHLPLFIPRKHSGSQETSGSKKNCPLAPVFSGITIKKTKSVKSIKRGFITWPSDDDKPSSSTDRVSYVMNRWDSQSSHDKNEDLFSEPSDFMDFCTDFVGDRRMISNPSGNSIKETKACAVSRMKNSALES
uniref:O-phosphoseryl-tRNA(Sec) selenium transferase n=1 Tax=Lygus hesperus TaxID=30085 RepID=A0A0A9YMP7_LYGHE